MHCGLSGCCRPCTRVALIFAHYCSRPDSIALQEPSIMCPMNQSCCVALLELCERDRVWPKPKLAKDFSLAEERRHSVAVWRDIDVVMHHLCTQAGHHKFWWSGKLERQGQGRAGQGRHSCGLPNWDYIWLTGMQRCKPGGGDKPSERHNWNDFSGENPKCSLKSQCTSANCIFRFSRSTLLWAWHEKLSPAAAAAAADDSLVNAFSHFHGDFSNCKNAL